MNNFSIKEYMNRITIFPPASLSPSGNRLAYISNVTGAPQVWFGKIEKTASQLLFPKPLTTDKEKSPFVFQESIHFITDDLISVVKDHHGDEQGFIEIHDLKKGTVDTVPRERGKDFTSFISGDKKKIFFDSNRELLSVTGLYQYDLKTKKVEKIFVDEAISSNWINTKPYNGQHFFIQTKSNTALLIKMCSLKN